MHLINHIARKAGVTRQSLHAWRTKGLPRTRVKELATGNLFVHEGAWVLEWDDKEWPIDDQLAERIRAMQAHAAAKALLKKSIQKEITARTLRLNDQTLKL